MPKGTPTRYALRMSSIPKTPKAPLCEWTVSARDADRPLQDFLTAALGVSRRVAKQHIDGRVVWVNGRCIWMAHHALRRGDLVRVAGRVVSPTARSARPKALRILFEDGDFLAVDKPAGLLANASDASAETVLREQTGLADLRAVHRLDRETTGCLLFAKQAAALEAAIRVFRAHRVSKTYRAIVHGRWSAEATTLDLPIAGERALTQVTCVRANDRASHLLIRIETGRTHQIRRHLAMARHPVVGDRQYGPKTLPDPLLQEVPHAQLHAVELQLDHPTRGGRLKVFAPLPSGFHRWLKALKLDEGRG